MAEALDSLLNQTYPNIEIIVVDDGSSDEGPEVLKRYAARGVKVISQRCGTASGARNRAFREARGEHVKFFDADDVLSADMIEKQVNRLNGRSDAVAMSEWGRFYNDDLSTYQPSRQSVWRDMDAREWLVESWTGARPMTQCGMFLIPRALLERAGGWDERLTLIDDFEFFARVLSEAREVLFTEACPLYYRSGVIGTLSGSKCDKAVGSAYLSATLGVQHLLAKRADECAKKACANIMQSFVYEYYPTRMDLIKQAEDMVQKLGGSKLEPGGGGGFHFLRRWLGWKAARRLQRAAGR